MLGTVSGLIQTPTDVWCGNWQVAMRSDETEFVPMFNNNNPYGYKLNVNHPLIRKIYLRYKAKLGIVPRVPLSDSQRFEFEEVTIKYLKEKGIVK